MAYTAEQASEYYQRNRERLRQLGRERYQQNRASVIAKTRAWGLANPDKVKRYARKSVLKVYGLTPEMWNSMFVAQGSRCAICQTAESVKWCTDHDHDSGKVRNILCNHCNAGLGQFRDSPQLLAAALVYLRAHGK
jgi:hypothetical protein